MLKAGDTVAFSLLRTGYVEGPKISKMIIGIIEEPYLIEADWRIKVLKQDDAFGYHRYSRYEWELAEVKT